MMISLSKMERDRIWTAVKAAGVENVAAAAGSSRHTVWRYCTGRTEKMNSGRLRRILKAADLDETDYLEQTEVFEIDEEFRAGARQALDEELLRLKTDLGHEIDPALVRAVVGLVVKDPASNARRVYKRLIKLPTNQKRAS